MFDDVLNDMSLLLPLTLRPYGSTDTSTASVNLRLLRVVRTYIGRDLDLPMHYVSDHDQGVDHEDVILAVIHLTAL